MRIRKRFPTPSFPSDLLLSRSAVAPPQSGVEQVNSNQPSDPPQQLADEIMAISNINTGWVHHENGKNEEKMKLKEFGDDETWREEEEKSASTNDFSRKITISYVEECTNTILLPSSSSAQGIPLKMGWCEGEYKVVPLKKRKGSFERNPKEETMSSKMKSKTNRKWVQINCEKTQVDQKITQDCNNIHSNGDAKKSKRGNVIMEGSRCSRVNGRGWRCCQPTLVGYALCEHHLGKGRLRSMASVRRHEVDDDGAPAPLGRQQQQQQPLMVTKKRTKVGVVKARSISSLLSQI